MTRRIVFGADDDNEVVEAVRSWIDEHHDLVAVEADLPWPSMAHALGTAVADGEADMGVVICWTGTGTAIAANKVPGVRAAQAHDAWVATNARRWNDANVLALSSRRLSADQAVECVRAFIETDEIDPDERPRIDELKSLG
ncbi:MAG: RpiB/LacA/LacB family sugar-phosphate isomerase [Actinomycetota bacterium]